MFYNKDKYFTRKELFEVLVTTPKNFYLVKKKEEYQNSFPKPVSFIGKTHHYLKKDVAEFLSEYPMAFPSHIRPEKWNYGTTEIGKEILSPGYVSYILNEFLFKEEVIHYDQVYDLVNKSYAEVDLDCSRANHAKNFLQLIKSLEYSPWGTVSEEVKFLVLYLVDEIFLEDLIVNDLRKNIDDAKRILNSDYRVVRFIRKLFNRNMQISMFISKQYSQ